MTTVKSPLIFEPINLAVTDEPSDGLADGESRAAPPETTSELLTEVLRSCIEEGSGRYVELDIGSFDDQSIEPLLYRLLGVVDATELLLGVSRANDGDLAYCRTDYGEPHYVVALAPEDNSSLSWDIWRVPATALWSGSLAGASLVLPAHNPGWMILTHPARGNPWLFPTHS